MRGSGRLLRDDGDHVRRLDSAGGEFRLIAPMHLVDEGTVPFGGRIEVVSEAAIDKWIDYISVGDQKMEMESVVKKREDVLGSDAFESFGGAVPVLIELFVIPEHFIEAVRGWKSAPELLDDRERLRPALMAVAANHVGDEKTSAGTERSLDAIEEAFEVDDMMQRLIGDDGVIFVSSAPGIKIAR